MAAAASANKSSHRHAFTSAPDDYDLDKAHFSEASEIASIVSKAFLRGDAFRDKNPPAGLERLTKEQALSYFTPENQKKHTWFVLRSQSQEHNKEIAAVMLYTDENDDLWSMHMLATNGKMKKVGLGELLFRKVEQYAIEQKKKFVRFDVACDTTVDDHPLIKFYQKLGCKITGKVEEFCADYPQVIVPVKRGGRILAIEMEKKLEPSTSLIAKKNSGTPPIPKTILQSRL